MSRYFSFHSTGMAPVVAIVLLAASGILGAASDPSDNSTLTQPKTVSYSSSEEPADPASHQALSTPTEPDPPYDVGIEGWSQAAQDKLGDWIAPIYEVIGSENGFGDFSLNYDNMAVEIFFQGDFPSNMTPIITAAEKAGVNIVKIEIKYGQKELEKFSKELFDNIDKAGIRSVSAIGPSPDYSNLEIEGPYITTDVALQQRIIDIAGEITSIPLSFADGSFGEDTGRQDDRSPFKSGARININSSKCTSGPSMSGTSSHYLLTAAHCANWANWQTFTTGDNVETIGDNSWIGVLYDTNDLDATLIHTDFPHTVNV